MESSSERVTREDLLLFVNACFACTGQKEFYSDGYGQRVSLAFLHEYIAGNYRALYARVLACGVNDLNRALVVRHLLATGAAFARAPAAARGEENALVTRTLHALPTHRAMHLLEDLAKRGVNNRRTRALTRAYLSAPGAVAFRAVKYRRSFRRAALHCHAPLEGETFAFLARGWKERSFVTPLFDAFRRAHYSEKAIYELPFSVAEGLAAKRGVARAVFLSRIEGRLTENERVRLLTHSKRVTGAAMAIDWARQPPTRVATYVLSLPMAERVARREELARALAQAAARAARRTGARFGKVACVIDRSYSSSGSSEKRQRPLAVALAVAAFLRASADELTVHCTAPTPDEILISARGTTDLATPVLAALRAAPELLVVVSDGFENDPPGIAGRLLEEGARLLPGCFILHVNPVFDVESYAPRGLSPRIPTMGIRDAEDLPTLIAFAKLALGRSSLAELDQHLEVRVRAFLEAGASR